MPSDPSPLRLFVSAGELSGDMHAANLLRAIAGHRDVGELRATALGSFNLAEAGAEVLFDTGGDATIGFIGNFLRAPQRLRLFQETVRHLQRFPPDAVILVDSRFFNLNLAKALRRGGYEGPIIYFIAPVLWQAASDPRYDRFAEQPAGFRRKVGKRFKLMKELVDLALVIYPVGLQLYQYFGVPHEFIGHPLCEVVKPSRPRSEFLEELGAAPGHPVIGLMPGSLREEVAVIGREMIQAARTIAESFPEATFALPVAHPALKDAIIALLKRYPVDLTLLEPEQRYDLVCHADLMIVASGTATHECAVAGTPHIVAYRLPWLYDLIYSTFTRFRLPAYAFPNIIAGEHVVPELVRGECNADYIAGVAMSLLDDVAEMARMRQRLESVRGMIYRPQPLERAADLIVRLIGSANQG
jgi:lipid-A-disaccharide synthase